MISPIIHDQRLFYRAISDFYLRQTLELDTDVGDKCMGIVSKKSMNSGFNILQSVGMRIKRHTHGTHFNIHESGQGVSF